MNELLLIVIGSVLVLSLIHISAFLCFSPLTVRLNFLMASKVTQKKRKAI